VPYLRLFALVAGGMVMAGSAAAALAGPAGFDPGFCAAKIATARFYGETILPATAGLVEPILRAGGTLRDLADDSV
jgi:hypothetical protein